MRFRCSEEGTRLATVIVVPPWQTMPRAVAAIRYVQADEDRDDTEPVNVCVVPDDDEARALPGWYSDEQDPQVAYFRLEPERVITWSSTQVRGFNPFRGNRSGPLPGGETAKESG